MTDPPSITIPPELKKKYPELVALILGSESMNAEERQYWVNILPVMTSEQLENLRQILQNERDQLAAIDRKYSREIAKLGRKQSVEEVRRRRRSAHAQRRSKEAEAEEAEQRREQEILRAIAEIEG